MGIRRTPESQKDGRPVVPPGADRWSEYMRWNAALADVIYGPDSAGLPVYLDLEEEILSQAAILADADGNPRSDLIDAVRSTLNPPGHGTGMFGGHIYRLRLWDVSIGEPPPIVALLALLSLAAEDMRQSDRFAANNYYDRLMPLLGVTTPEDKKRVINAYRKASFDLWESLNGWLEDLHGDRGLPTAYAYAHAHVGRPLSQALIRATDRDKLGEFFGELGLEPRSRLSPLDMEPLLAEWIGRDPSPASNHMRAMWKRPGARERITDIACQLLETWEPIAGDHRSILTGFGALGRARLQLLALVRTFPSRGLELNITGPAYDDEQVVHLEDPSLGALVEPPLAIEDLPGRRWRFAQADEIAPGSMLEGLVRIRRPSGPALERRPRRVVPLKRDELLQAFVEVERLGLGEDGVILCQEGLGRLLQEALEQIARPGFSRVNSDLPGLPGGWALFVNIQVLTPLPVAPRMADGWPVDFNVLQPLATSQLILSGGLQLPGRVRRWSSLAPPEVRATSEDANGLALRIERVGAFAKAALELERVFDEPFMALDLGDVHLRDGDYEVTAVTRPIGYAKPQRLNTRLRLRSGDAPNPRPSTQAPLARPLDELPIGVMGALDWDAASPAVRGALTLGGTSMPASTPAISPVGRPLWWDHRRERGPDGSSAAPRSAASRIVLPGTDFTDCFRTGAHVLRLPTFYGKTTRSTVDGVCKHCGLVKRFPARYRPAKRRAALGSLRVDIPRIDVSEVRPISEDGTATANVALDALSHDRRGSSTSFEQLALQVEASQLFVDRFARALDALGHIEVARDELTTRVIGWEVMPTALVEISDGSLVLTGHRCQALFEALADLSDAFELKLHRTAQGRSAPDRLWLGGATIERADNLVRRLEERTGITADVAAGAANCLAGVLPSLSIVVDRLPRQPMIAARSARRWEAGVARWLPVEDASAPGAYQLAGSTTVYCLRDNKDVMDGSMRRADARLVKHAASLETRELLIGYDAPRQMMYAPLGADLPGLYHRAAVLSTGLLPTEDETHHLVAYHGVPADLAEQLSSLLGS